jgi:hypothetical protein
MESLANYIKHPSFVTTILALIVSGLILSFGYNWAEQKKSEQQVQIKDIQAKIEATRPPANDPQTDWQRTIVELSQKQKFFWGRRLIQFVSLLPDRSQLLTMAIQDDAFESRGLLLSSESELRLNDLGDANINYLNDALLKENLGPWKLVSLSRVTPDDVDFTLRAAIQ